MPECHNCGLTTNELNADEIDEIVIGPAGEGRDSACSVCRADELYERTVLSKQEAKVAAHKQISGAPHDAIAERISLEKSTVDEYSRRMKEKVTKARATQSELSEFL